MIPDTPLACFGLAGLLPMCYGLLESEGWPDKTPEEEARRGRREDLRLARVCFRDF
jgi:hypothetical protein